MKKILLTLVMIVAIGFGASAQNDSYSYGYYQDNNTQYSDGFFSSGNESRFQYRDSDNMPIIPNTGWYCDQSAPLGSGLLLLAGFGAAYAVRRRKKSDF